MSIYYECRFKDIKLDLKDRSDIYQWLKQVDQICKTYAVIVDNDHLTPEEVNELNKLYDELSLPKELLEYDRVGDLGNSFTDNLDSIFTYDDDHIITIDLCIGNKNKDSDIERLIWLLKPHILSGNIYFYNEDFVQFVDIENSFKDGWGDDSTMYTAYNQQ